MKRIAKPLLAVLVIWAASTAPQLYGATPGAYFVDINGNDAWSGASAASNSSRSDGPFATVQRALRATREWRKSAGEKGRQSASIHFGPGIHLLKQTLTLLPEDSDLTLEGAGEYRTVLSGGRIISDWKEIQREGQLLWTAEVPAALDGKWVFRELWINGRRAVRSRYPGKGYLKVAKLIDPSPDWTKGQTRFGFAPGDLKAWKTAADGEVVIMNRWVESRLPIREVDENQRIISFTKRSVFALEEGDLYYVEGTFEALDEPGEWYLDRRAGKVYYRPLPGDSLQNIKAVAPTLTQALRVEGRPEQNQFVDHLVVRGLAFSHTEWCFPEGFANGSEKPTISPEPAPEVGGFGQAAIGVPGAVWCEGLRRSLFENCAFTDLGNYGLELAQGCQSNRVVQCDFSNLGAGGIKLGETTIRGPGSEQTRATEVSACRIHDGGKMFHSAIGVWIGQSPDNRILHNSIHDFYYTGISVGWTWGYGPALASNNVVAFNHVHHIGIKSDGDGPILSDMGGIYTLGKQPGSRVENNLWHDIAGLRYGGWGIYFDEGSSGILAASNVVYRTTHGGFHQHYGETNILRNNIFAFGRDQQLQRTRVEPHTSFLFQTNVVYFDAGVVLGGDWSKDSYDIDWNVYFDARPGANPADMRFANSTLEQWQERGHDRHSLIENPLFAAPETNNFALRAKSPALNLGFQPIDLSQVGAGD